MERLIAEPGRAMAVFPKVGRGLRNQDRPACERPRVERLKQSSSASHDWGADRMDVNAKGARPSFWRFDKSGGGDVRCREKNGLMLS
jgi:hypothetical protein